MINKNDGVILCNNLFHEKKDGMEEIVYLNSYLIREMTMKATEWLECELDIKTAIHQKESTLLLLLGMSLL